MGSGKCIPFLKYSCKYVRSNVPDLFLTMKEFRNGFFTGLSLQLAIGPVFFLIANLTLQKSFFDGFAGVLAVTVADTLFIASSILGIVRIPGNAKWRNVSRIVGSFFLIVIGCLILRSAWDSSIILSVIPSESGIFASFASVFLITIFNPLTIVFFTSLFTVQAAEHNYSRKQLILFGSGTGLATFAFMGGSVIIFSLMRGFVPVFLMQILNGVVGLLLVGYGIRGLFIDLKESK